MPMETDQQSDLRERAREVRWAYAQALAQGLRQREAAHQAGVSEGEAVAMHTPSAWPDRHRNEPGMHAIPLIPHWLELLQALQTCGPLMALTRNDSVVHEKTGVYRDVSGDGPVGLALGADIDLRLFWRHWCAGFAVCDAPDRPPRSLQFYDSSGYAVHKIFTRPATDETAWMSVVEQFFDADAPPPMFVPRASASPVGLRDMPDGESFLNDWSAMQDTHEFFGILKRHGISRIQAMQMARGVFTHDHSPHMVERLLKAASSDAVPIMVFVGNPGCIQIHTGPVQRVQTMDLKGQTWVNVLDEGFNLHLLLDDVASCWSVRKPTSDGDVHSLEVYDRRGECIAMFFGARKPGQPESSAWRALLRSIDGVSA
jgi:putative hemin transport protein